MVGAVRFASCVGGLVRAHAESTVGVPFWSGRERRRRRHVQQQRPCRGNAHHYHVPRQARRRRGRAAAPGGSRGVAGRAGEPGEDGRGGVRVGRVRDVDGAHACAGAVDDRVERVWRPPLGCGVHEAHAAQHAHGDFPPWRVQPELGDRRAVDGHPIRGLAGQSVRHVPSTPSPG